MIVAVGVLAGLWSGSTASAAVAPRWISLAPWPVTDSNQLRAPSGAATLADGRVFVAGAAGEGDSHIYDPATNAWSAAPAYPNSRSGAVSAAILGGKVLLTSGVIDGTVPLGTPTSDSQLYDPATNSWRAAAPIPVARRDAAAAALPGGGVLVTGGYDYNGPIADTRIYNPDFNAWSAAAPLPAPRADAVAVAIGGGKVLVTGGFGCENATPSCIFTEYTMLFDSQIYDFQTNTWSPAAELPWPARRGAAAAPLPSGRALVVGGTSVLNDAASYIADALVYDPLTNSWSPTADLPRNRAWSVAAPLLDGSVFVTHGQFVSNGSRFWDLTSNVYTVAGAPSASITSPPNGATYEVNQVGGTTVVPDVNFSCAAGESGVLLPGLRGCSASIDGGAPIGSGKRPPGTIGVHTIVVTAVGADSQRTSVTRTYTVKLKPPPTISITTPPDGATYIALELPNAQFSCTAGAGTNLKAGLDGCSAKFDGSPTPKPTNTLLPGTLGSHTMVVTAAQTDGQTTSVTRSYTVKPGAPIAIIYTPSDLDVYIVGSVPNTNIYCQAGVGVNLKPGLDGCSATIDGGARVGNNAPLNATVGSHTIVLTAAQTDGQTKSVTHSYTVKLPAPTATITTPPDGAVYTTVSVPNANFSCTAGAGATLKPGLAGCLAIIDDGPPVGSGTPLAASVGTHKIGVAATQTDGQFTWAWRSYTVNAAPPRPTVSITSPASGAEYAAGSVPNAQFTCTAGTGGTLKPGLEGCNGVFDFGSTKVASGTPLANTLGVHVLVVTATDTLGQTSEFFYHVYAVNGPVTGPPPTVTITTPQPYAAFAAGSVPAAEFACTKGSGQALRNFVWVTDPNLQYQGCHAEIDGVVVLDGPTPANSVPLATSVGPHEITVVAVDNSAQQTRKTHTYYVNGPVTGPPPSVAITTPSDGAVYDEGSVPAAAFTCTAGQGSTLRPALHGCSATIDGAPAVGSGTPLAASLGAHTIGVAATDMSGQRTWVWRSYTVNDPPTISNIADRFTKGATPVINFTVGDKVTPVGSLTVTATSANPTLVPAANVVVGGSGANRTVQLTPAAGQSGTATITVTVSDGTKTASDTFVLTVDITPPTCALSAIRRPGPSGRDEMDLTTQDVGSGIATIVVTTAVNIVTPVPITFTPGTTSPVLFTVTKADQSMLAQIAFDVTDRAGNQKSCR